MLAKIVSRPACRQAGTLQLSEKTGFPTKDFGNDRLKNIVKGQRPNKGICGGKAGKIYQKARLAKMGQIHSFA